MGNILVANQALLFAVRQAKQPSVVLFGDRGWEGGLIQQRDLIVPTKKSLGEILVERIGLRARTMGRAYAAKLRRVLTIGLAPLYRYGNSFTLLSEDDLDVAQTTYPESDSNAVDSLAMDLWTAMTEANKQWQTLFSRELAEAQLNESDRYFTLSVVMAAMAAEDGFRAHERAQEEMEDRNRKVAAQVKETAEKQIREQLKAQMGGKRQEEKTAIEPITPRWMLDDIGGCAEAKERLTDLALLMVRPGAAAAWGRNLPVGILISGPPGTGKTMLVHALARQTNRLLYSARMSDVFTMWYGESPRKLRALFEAVQKTGGILFLDEADGIIAGRGGQTTHEESVRVVNEFCTQMELLKPDGKVVVVLATNFEGNLDEAAVRAKRVDIIIQIDRPNERERKEILQVHRQSAEGRVGRSLFTGIDWDAIASTTLGLSGADLAAIIDKALLQKAIQQARDDVSPHPVTADELADSIQWQCKERLKKKHIVGFEHP